MKKKSLYSLAGILLFIILLTGVYCASTWQSKKIEQLNKQISFLKDEFVPMRFKILEKTQDSILVSIKFYDLDMHKVSYTDKNGKNKNYVRIKMPGQTLALDFIVIPINGRYVAFPYKVFTDAIKPQDALVLFPFYDKNNFPQIYFSQYSTPTFNAGMKALFIKIKKGDVEDIKGYFGSMVQDVKKLNEFDSNHVYKVVVHSAKGGIEIIRED